MLALLMVFDASGEYLAGTAKDPPKIPRKAPVATSKATTAPWLAQMGQDRAGFYSYDWLERALTALAERTNT
jgi:hypothetical protein